MNFFKSPPKDIDNTKKCHFNVFLHSTTKLFPIKLPFGNKLLYYREKLITLKAGIILPRSLFNNR